MCALHNGQAAKQVADNVFTSWANEAGGPAPLPQGILVLCFRSKLSEELGQTEPLQGLDSG